jgi:hypothetical protein
MNLHHVPEALILHHSLWAGRIMSAIVVIALVADGTVQLFAPAQIARQDRAEDGGGRDGVKGDGLLGGAICAHVRIGELGSPPEIISLLLGVMTWGGLYARDPRIRAILPLIR